MRAVVQRVKESRVDVEGRTVGTIRSGLLVLLGVAAGDQPRDVDYLADKIMHLRIFDDPNGQMNMSLLDVGAEMLVVSQFTLLADCRKGRRPSYSKAAGPETAEQLYRHFIDRVSQAGIHTASGRFGALMEVHLINDGPVTLILDSR